MNHSRSNNCTTALVSWIVICLSFILLSTVNYAWILYIKSRKVDGGVAESSVGKMDLRDRRMMVLAPGLFVSVTLIFWASVLTHNN